MAVDSKDFAAAAPYPGLGQRSAQSANATATPISAEELAAEIGIKAADIERARRLLPVAREAVERYAPSAPQAMKNEAIIRFAGYLTGSDFGGVQSEGIGPRSVTYTAPTNNAAAFRNSGAAMLLTHYKRRRAGAI